MDTDLFVKRAGLLVLSLVSIIAIFSIVLQASPENKLSGGAIKRVVSYVKPFTPREDPCTAIRCDPIDNTFENKAEFFELDEEGKAVCICSTRSGDITIHRVDPFTMHSSPW